MFTKEVMEQIDNNKRKALNVIKLALSPVESGDVIDTLTVLETIKDYLQNNDVIFNANV